MKIHGMDLVRNRLPPNLIGLCMSKLGQRVGHLIGLSMCKVKYTRI